MSQCVKSRSPVLWTEKNLTWDCTSGLYSDYGDVVFQLKLKNGKQKTRVSLSIINFTAGLKLFSQKMKLHFFSLYVLNQQAAVIHTPFHKFLSLFLAGTGLQVLEVMLEWSYNLSSSSSTELRTDDSRADCWSLYKYMHNY